MFIFIIIICCCCCRCCWKQSISIVLQKGILMWFFVTNFLFDQCFFCHWQIVSCAYIFHWCVIITITIIITKECLTQIRHNIFTKWIHKVQNYLPTSQVMSSNLSRIQVDWTLIITIIIIVIYIKNCSLYSHSSIQLSVSIGRADQSHIDWLDLDWS